MLSRNTSVSAFSTPRQTQAPDSWRTAVEQSVAPFLGDSTSKLLAAFDQVANRWGHLSPQQGLPFDSGVCPDGSPVELSVQWNRDRQRQVRFIAQPADPSASASANLDHMRQCALQFLINRNNNAAHAQLSRMLELFPDGLGSDSVPAGNFFLWLGLAVAEDGREETKVYLNPWAALEDHQGAYLVYRALEEAQLGTAALPWISRVIDETGMIPLIVGLNFNSQGLKSTKIYFGRADVDAEILKRMRLTWPGSTTDDAWGASFDRAISEATRGEVHIGLEYRSADVPPALRFNLLCQDWFLNDAAVLSALDGELSQSALSEAASLCSGWQSQRRFNFLGLDGRRATLYFKAAQIQSR